MPRNKAVDYPQVHPPTSHAQYSLAPPQNSTHQGRFSWQAGSNELVSPSLAAERRLEAGTTDEKQEHRKSEVPPLPILPDHLGGPVQQDTEHRGHMQSQETYPIQQSNQFPYQSHPQSQPYQYQLTQPSSQQHGAAHLGYQQHQQPQFQPQVQVTTPSQYVGPPVSYEASQAAYQGPHLTQQKMQEQPVYNAHHDVSHTQLSAHALPLNSSHQATTTEQYESSDHKPDQQELQRSQSRPQPQRLLPVHLGPDVNPLSPTSPTGPMSPIHGNSNMDLPPFPQAASYVPTTSTSGPTRGGTWHHTLGSCAEPTTCLSSLFCPCVVYGRTQYRLSLKSAKKDPTNMLGYSAVNGSCVAWSVLCGVNILLTAIQHTRVRKAYEMDEGSGNVASDCVKSICCCCCVIAQDDKEMKVREEKKGGTDMGYKSPSGMVFGAPPR